MDEANGRSTLKCCYIVASVVDHTANRSQNSLTILFSLTIQETVTQQEAHVQPDKNGPFLNRSVWCRVWYHVITSSCSVTSKVLTVLAEQEYTLCSY